MNRIEYGNKIFEQDAIKRGNIYKARSLSCSVLEIDTLSIDVVSDDTSLTSFVRYDPLTFFYNGKQVGLFYVEDIKRIAVNLYTIYAVSIIGVFEETDHFGGIYNGDYAGDIIRDICAGTPVHVKSNIEKVQIYGHLPINSKRGNLSQVLLAIGACAKTDNNGALRIEPLWAEPIHAFTSDDVFLGGDVKYNTPAKSVIVTEHQYTEGAERVTLFNGEAKQDEIIKFDSPCHGLTATGLTIIASNANFAKVAVGTGQITGIRYIHNTKDVVFGGSVIDDTTEKVLNATLVSKTNSYAVAERVLYYGGKSEQTASDFVYVGQEPGDIIEAPNAYLETQRSCIQSLDISIGNTLRCKQVGLVGFVPPEPDYITSGEADYVFGTVLTDSGEFTFPAGVVAAKAVLIQGGEGGIISNGSRGEEGEYVMYAGQHGEPTIAYGGGGGIGGTPKDGGKGGKVNIVNFPVSTNAKYEYSAGAGGPDYDGEWPLPTKYGDNSIFWMFSSADGIVYENGYYDQGTDKTYALPGKPGTLYGAKGGDGGNAIVGNASNGKDGENVVGQNGTIFLGGTKYPGTIVHSSYGTQPLVIYCGGGGGGGAGSGANEWRPASAPGYESYDRGSAGGWGGDGAPAEPLAEEELLCYGHGGNGGNGGGGGGGGGAVISSASAFPFYWGGAGGIWGTGRGTPGVQGCIILYYGYNKGDAAISGFLTSDSRMLIDKTGRRLLT